MKKLSKILVISSILVVCFFFGFLLQKRYLGSKTVEGVSIRGGEPLDIRVPVPVYLQGDERWSAVKLGGTDELIRSSGCTVCATAMALTSQGYEVEPAELNKRLIAHSGFTESGLLIWGAIQGLSENRFSVEVFGQPTHDLIDENLRSGNPVIAKVLYEGRIWHWVLISGKSDLNYLMHDPLGSSDGFESMNRYAQGIFAMRTLKRL